MPDHSRFNFFRGFQNAKSNGARLTAIVVGLNHYIFQLAANDQHKIFIINQQTMYDTIRISPTVRRRRSTV